MNTIAYQLHTTVVDQDGQSYDLPVITDFSLAVAIERKRYLENFIPSGAKSTVKIVKVEKFTPGELD